MPAKKTTKQSRLKQTLNWLKPTSPAKGMVLFALVFGLAGGGYYVYKSYASNTWAIFPKDMTTYAFAAKGTDCHSSNKGCVDIVRLNPAADARLGQGGRVTMPLFLNPQEFSRPRFARICVFERVEVWGSTIDTWSMLHIRWRTSADNIGNVEDYARNGAGDARLYESKDYQYKCTKWWGPKKPEVTEVEIQRHWDVADGWSNPIDVSSVVLEWY